MNVLLIHLPFYQDQFFKEGFFTADRQSPLFPIGIASIAGLIREKGYNVEILDIYAEQLDYNNVINTLKNKHFDIVGIGALVNQYAYLKWIAKEIKKIKDIPIVLGSGLGTACYEVVLKNIPEVDVCVRGEGEITFYELLKKNFENLENITGIAYRKNDNIIKNPDRKLIEDIDILALPAYDLVNIEKYFDTKFYETGVYNVRTKYAGHLKILPLVTGRGCPYNCNFCGKIIPKVRFRSIANIINEMKFLMSNYEVKGIHFVDELFVIDKDRTIKLCEYLRKLNIRWDCQGRVDRVDYELLKTMKESGCVAVGFGIESGAQKILDNINKRITVRQIKKAINACKEIGLPAKIQLIFGCPGETKETIEETVKLLKEVHDPGRRFSYITPIPGTKLYKEALERNMIGDEEQWLYKIKESFDYRKPAINFTAFKIDKILKIMRYYYNKIVFNYLLYQLSHPKFLLNNFIKDKKGALELIIRSLMYIFKIDFLRNTSPIR